MGLREGPKIAIVGGSGYIGSHLARHLGRFFKIRIIDIKPPTAQNGDIEFVRCDIRSREGITRALRGVDLVIHSAAIQIPLINENPLLGYEVNIIGTQNVCDAVVNSESAQGLILTGTWHTIGERGIKGGVDESFGYRPDKVESRARLYALSKIAQESIVRYYDEMSEKIFGIIRMGTVLGKGMPEKSVANIFITKALKGEPLTPFRHSMYRPMLYVDIRDVSLGFLSFARIILEGDLPRASSSLDHIVNIVYPEPITIIELAHMVRELVIEETNGRVVPPIEVIDKGEPVLFTPDEKDRFNIDISRARELLGLMTLRHPRDSLREIIRDRMSEYSSK